MSEFLTARVLKAIERSPSGIVNLEILTSLRLCDVDTLKTTLSRLNKTGKIIRLKRGVYSAKPMKDAFAAAQATFKGYLGFTSALYLHRLIAEMPFTVTIVTPKTSTSKRFGPYEFKAVALKQKALGFERLNNYVVSTRAKTLFDCIFLPNYSVEAEKLIKAFKQAKLTQEEWHEFDIYVDKFLKGKIVSRFRDIKKKIRG